MEKLKSEISSQESEEECNVRGQLKAYGIFCEIYFILILCDFLYSIGVIETTITVENDFFKVCKKQYGDRIRNAVAEGWTGKLFKICYEKLNLPCVWSFDRASWRKNDIICKGNCSQKECKATIEATLPHRTNNLELIIEKYKSSVVHDPKNKRRLQWEEKEKLTEMLRGKSALALRNELARTMQNEKLTERADIPTLNAMNLYKSRDQCFIGLNVFEALDELKNVHVNCIHKIGYDPFFVIYETPAQSEYYAKERVNGRSIISVDATGPGVKSPTSNPKCIYLYIVCVHGNYRLLYYYYILFKFNICKFNYYLIYFLNQQEG